MIFPFERGGHRDEEGFSGLRRKRGTQIALRYRGVNHHVQIGLNDMNFATVNGFYCARVDIDTNYLDFPRGEHGGRGEADVAEANNGYLFEFHELPGNLLII